VFNFATIAMSAAFTSETNGLCPVTINGQGTAAYVTQDGGKTWSTAPSTAQLMFMGGAAQGDSAVILDLFGAEYSDSNSTNTNYNFVATKIPVWEFLPLSLFLIDVCQMLSVLLRSLMRFGLRALCICVVCSLLWGFM
jgi:hypothetical protein